MATEAKIIHRPFGPHCVFQCPSGKGICSVEVRPTPGDGARWDQHGPDSAPTLTPSINCSSCGWHGYIVNGEASDAPPGLSTLHVCGCGEARVVNVQATQNPNGGVAIALAILNPSAERSSTPAAQQETN